MNVSLSDGARVQWVRFCFCLAVDNASSTEWFPIDVSYPSRPTVKRFCQGLGTCVPARALA